MSGVVENLGSVGAKSLPINHVLPINSTDEVITFDGQTWLKTGITRNKSDYPDANFGGLFGKTIPLSHLNANAVGGICTDNNSIFIATDSGVVELSSDFSVNKTHDTKSIASLFSGITFDGSFFWGVSRARQLFKMDRQFSMISQYDLSAQVPSAEGLVYVAPYLYVASYQDGKLYRYIGGAYQNHTITPNTGSFNLQGLAYENNEFHAVTYEGRILKFDTNGKVTSNTAGEASSLRGILTLNGATIIISDTSGILGFKVNTAGGVGLIPERKHSDTGVPYYVRIA